ncbi:zinc finger MYND domain-containing protein [Aspergillus mulundensis]|uniref:MYND-type domain-containing protein n=1 Tax=Aspergillus mulundensis TaxID=1810919 RepID=A0A3D8SDI6_9EURO|nr:hypothetical protein DSM5745_04490 [Aspergillus mulundensis]RDW84164.1 hypothetical protein DSM5745_04490 [Aspergillus mulundensis]
MSDIDEIRGQEEGCPTCSPTWPSVNSTSQSQMMTREAQLGTAVRDQLPYYEKSEDACVMCNTTTSRQCSVCKSARYYSSTCRSADYPVHKLLCRKFAHQARRPSLNHKKAIFFPANKAKPQMVWVKCEGRRGETSVECELPDKTPFFHGRLGRHVIEETRVRCRRLGLGYSEFRPSEIGYFVTFYYRDETAYNESLARTLAAYSRCLPYRGPLLAVLQIPHQFLNNMPLSDFRDVLDFMEKWRVDWDKESLLSPPRAVRGIKISCGGERGNGDSSMFVPVETQTLPWVRQSHGSLSAVSVRLGMPLRLWRYPDPDTDVNRSNSEAAVFVVREDGVDLDIADLQKMCSFNFKDVGEKIVGLYEKMDELWTRIQRSGQNESPRTWEELKRQEEIRDRDEQAIRQRVLDFITRGNMLSIYG